MTAPRLLAAIVLAALLGAACAFAVHHAWIGAAVLLLPISVLAAGLHSTTPGQRVTR